MYAVTQRRPRGPKPEAAAMVVATLAALRPAAHRWSPDSASAEDLMHDTFERAWRNLDRFEPGSCLKAWLATLMYRIAIDAQRRRAQERRSRRDQVHVVDFSSNSASESQPRLSPIEIVDLDDLREMTAVLREPFRSTFVLWAFDRLSYREISRSTGVPVATVGTRLMRARLILRSAALGSECEE